MSHDPPTPWSFIPFIVLLLAIAILPLIRPLENFWGKNRNKLLLALVLGGATMAYYLLAWGPGAALQVLHEAVLAEYAPFIILLFALYTISGGIHISGDIRATPLANSAFLALGAVLASFIGTTGASMLLIRPLLRTNQERKIKVHTVIFFIFIVSNIGGCLTPLGDPPLFLGYILGVPFWWTLKMFLPWLVANGALLAVYFIWDRWAYRREGAQSLVLDAMMVRPLGVRGSLNFPLLCAVVACVALVDPNLEIPGTSFKPPPFLREGLLLVLSGLSWVGVPGNREIRSLNRFSFTAIAEVACLFLGIFICMQPPITFLHERGAELGLKTPAAFFWASGGLSSFLDNAPTYVVFFQTAQSIGTQAGSAGRLIPRGDLLLALSMGAVFMGANTYIGNGPNFMVKTIAEHSGVKMPSFFGYMAYSGAILLPLFALLMFIFLWT